MDIGNLATDAEGRPYGGTYIEWIENIIGVPDRGSAYIVPESLGIGIGHEYRASLFCLFRRKYGSKYEAQGLKRKVPDVVDLFSRMHSPRFVTSLYTSNG